jgi:hypothetical protein
MATQFGETMAKSIKLVLKSYGSFIQHGKLILSGVFFLFHLKVGVEESIVGGPLVSLQSNNTNSAKSKVSFKQLIRDL